MKPAIDGRVNNWGRGGGEGARNLLSSERKRILKCLLTVTAVPYNGQVCVVIIIIVVIFTINTSSSPSSSSPPLLSLLAEVVLMAMEFCTDDHVLLVCLKGEVLPET